MKSLLIVPMLLGCVQVGLAWAADDVDHMAAAKAAAKAVNAACEQWVAIRAKGGDTKVLATRIRQACGDLADHLAKTKSEDFRVDLMAGGEIVDAGTMKSPDGTVCSYWLSARERGLVLSVLVRNEWGGSEVPMYGPVAAIEIEPKLRSKFAVGAVAHDPRDERSLRVPYTLGDASGTIDIQWAKGFWQMKPDCGVVDSDGVWWPSRVEDPRVADSLAENVDHLAGAKAAEQAVHAACDQWAAARAKGGNTAEAGRKIVRAAHDFMDHICMWERGLAELELDLPARGDFVDAGTMKSPDESVWSYWLCMTHDRWLVLTAWGRDKWSKEKFPFELGSAGVEIEPSLWSGFTVGAVVHDPKETLFLRVPYKVNGTSGVIDVRWGDDDRWEMKPDRGIIDRWVIWWPFRTERPKPAANVDHAAAAKAAEKSLHAACDQFDALRAKGRDTAEVAAQIYRACREAEIEMLENYQASPDKYVPRMTSIARRDIDDAGKMTSPDESVWSYWLTARKGAFNVYAWNREAWTETDVPFSDNVAGWPIAPRQLWSKLSFGAVVHDPKQQRFLRLPYKLNGVPGVIKIRCVDRETCEDMGWEATADRGVFDKEGRWWPFCSAPPKGAVGK